MQMQQPLGTFLLGPDKNYSICSQFLKTPTSQKLYTKCHAHFMPTYNSETNIQFVEA